MVGGRVTVAIKTSSKEWREGSCSWSQPLYSECIWNLSHELQSRTQTTGLWPEIRDTLSVLHETWKSQVVKQTQIFQQTKMWTVHCSVPHKRDN